MHLDGRQLPQVALAFEQFLLAQGQARIQQQLAQHPGFAGGQPRAARKRSRAAAA
jgi:hypothetical protein